MNSKNSLQVFFCCLAACAAGCSFVPRFHSESEPAPVQRVPMELPPAPNNGAIYSNASGLALFEDLKARRVGDLLTILLEERTDASKTASTTTTKDTDVDTGTPTLAGRGVTDDGVNILGNVLGAEREFTGEGDASQSNSLDGRITVMVMERLPNGYLRVQGEKQLTLNQGDELIRVSGLVRPIDISTENTVPSTRVANAQITYSGSGPLADANRPGWLGRFFDSKWFPF